MASYSVFSTLSDMLHPERERGSVFVNSHPDSAIFSAIVVDRTTGKWHPLGSFLNVHRILSDLQQIIDFARGPVLTKTQVVLSILRNLKTESLPAGLALPDLYRLFRQCSIRAAGEGTADWSARIYDQERWGVLFIGGMWFQDLYNYEIPNLHLSTAVVADAGPDPATVPLLKCRSHSRMPEVGDRL